MRCRHLTLFSSHWRYKHWRRRRRRQKRRCRHIRRNRSKHRHINTNIQIGNARKTRTYIYVWQNVTTRACYFLRRLHFKSEYSCVCVGVCVYVCVFVLCLRPASLAGLKSGRYIHICKWFRITTQVLQVRTCWEHHLLQNSGSDVILLNFRVTAFCLLFTSQTCRDVPMA